MKVEVTKRIKDKPQDVFYNLDAGDQISVPDTVAAIWIRNGWAQEAGASNGSNETAHEVVTLDVNNTKHATKSTEV